MTAVIARHAQTAELLSLLSHLVSVVCRKLYKFIGIDYRIRTLVKYWAGYAIFSIGRFRICFVKDFGHSYHDQAVSNLRSSTMPCGALVSKVKSKESVYSAADPQNCI